MKKSIVLIGIFSLLSLQSLLAQKTANQKTADGLLKQMTTEKGIVGITAAYAVNGDIQWQNAEGYSSKETQLPFTETTLTRTASIAKSMTAIAVLQLVEQDLINLEEPIQTYLADYENHPHGKITIKQLLSHTSGLSGYKSSKETESKTEYATLEAANQFFKDRDLLFEPGTQFSYSTYGYVILGRVIEAVSNESYEVYMTKNIIEKAGMTHTGIEHMGESYVNKSSLYHKKKRKAKLKEQNNLSNRIPGGGFYTTLNDMILFGNAVLNHTLISEQSFDLMTSATYSEREGNQYGLGWYLYGKSPNHNAIFGHSGAQTGTSTQLMLLPKQKIVVIVLANTSGTWEDVIRFSNELINLSLTEFKQLP